MWPSSKKSLETVVLIYIKEMKHCKLLKRFHTITALTLAK